MAANASVSMAAASSAMHTLRQLQELQLQRLASGRTASDSERDLAELRSQMDFLINAQQQTQVMLYQLFAQQSSTNSSDLQHGFAQPPPIQTIANTHTQGQGQGQGQASMQTNMPIAPSASAILNSAADGSGDVLQKSWLLQMHGAEGRGAAVPAIKPTAPPPAYLHEIYSLPGTDAIDAAQPKQNKQAAQEKNKGSRKPNNLKRRAVS